MKIVPSERWLLLGKTGSGKTQLAKYFLRKISAKWPVVIVDPNWLWLGKGKGARQDEWASRREVGTIEKPHLVDGFNPRYHVQLIQPDEDDSDALEHMCYDLMKAGDHFIYFDETEGIATATSVPKYIRVLWKRGRAHNIGAWASTQVPRGIPRLFKSQAEHRIVLKVGEEDAEVASEIVHVPTEIVKRLHKYEWIYYNEDMDIGEIHNPIPLKV
jgi:Helicase HerA, central domain